MLSSTKILDLFIYYDFTLDDLRVENVRNSPKEIYTLQNIFSPSYLPTKSPSSSLSLQKPLPFGASEVSVMDLVLPEDQALFSSTAVVLIISPHGTII